MPLRPQLFIGVGGTGGKTVGMIHHQLSETLKRAGITEMPAGWQFLHIDVAAEIDVRGDGLVYELPRDTYVPLTNNQSTYIGLHQTISSSLALSGAPRHVVWDAWRPNPAENVPVAIHLGAGQFRALGRVAAIAGLENIRNRISSALARMNDESVPGEFAKIQRALGATVEPGNAESTVFVLGSLAGGSGSGMFLEVCDVVRACNAIPIGVAFAPDVFVRGDGSMDPGIAPNTFLAVSELSHAMWRVDEHAPYVGRTEVFARAKVPRPPGASTAGPETLFLVGRGNGQSTLGDAKDVYRVMARNLAEIAMDENLATSLHAYSRANAASREGGSADLLGLSYGSTSDGGGKDYGAFSGLGFGRVTLGRDFFERYAADECSAAWSSDCWITISPFTTPATARPTIRCWPKPPPEPGQGSSRPHGSMSWGRAPMTSRMRSIHFPQSTSTSTRSAAASSTMSRPPTRGAQSPPRAHAAGRARRSIASW